MKASNSLLNRDQQVEVVIRLKPNDSEAHPTKCVYLSDKENELVVQTENKKQIFVFDHIANQNSSQMDIYRMIGEEVVQRSFDGYNCCIFAYGQTGAGKTYSVMGNLADMHSNYYSQYRGLLPRIIEDVFNQSANHASDKCTITCSYMEVYNEQIFDLLSPQKRIHQIREDFKRGVFVEGLIEKRVTSYKQGIQMLLEGEKTRRIASTSMNTESSRSHAIFTISIETEVMEDETLKVRKSKLNIVDLAGSQRIKHTNVVGQQLKEGCNINKSLHVLGNVINSLVESAKKKKHIPFRDSKLTHYLKDSLGGNSITKLLANVHTGKLYLGDTLSTLMFAKRAKILKLKVEINENVTQNFDSLRKEVRKLREELAQARYFKNQTQRTDRPSSQQDSETTYEKATTDHIVEVAPKCQILEVFQENQLHYKSLIEVYEEHLANCHPIHQNSKIKRPLNMVTEWRNLQKKNTALANLVKRFPAFTKIYKENLILRQQEKNNSIIEFSRNEEKQKNAKDQNILGEITNGPRIEKSEIQDIIGHYEKIIAEMQQKFTEFIQSLEKSYVHLEQECKIKDKRLKDFMRAQNLPPEISELKNENEYLHLNILNLQNEISKLHENQNKMNLERKELKKISHRNSVLQLQNSVFNSEDQDSNQLFFIQKLQQIKSEALKEMEKVEIQRQEAQNIINELHKRINALMVQNAQLQMKGSRNRSNKKTLRQMLSRAASTDNLKYASVNIFEAEQSQVQQICRKTQQQWQQQLTHLHDSYKKQIEVVKTQIQGKQKQIDNLRLQLKSSKNFDNIEEQFGKNLAQILSQYRENTRKISNTKSLINIHEFKEQDPLQMKMEMKNDQKNMKKHYLPDSKLFKAKQSKIKKEEPLSTRNSMMHTKKPFFSSK